MAEFKIAVMEGDGIGPEIVAEGIKVLNEIASKFNHRFQYEYVYVGGCAIDRFGEPLPQSEVDKILSCDALFFGSVGGPKWDNLPQDKKPEAGLLGIRKALGAFANLRPAKVFDELIDASTLKPDVIRGIDILVVRELTGGIYFGKPKGIFEENGTKKALNTMVYTYEEIERIVRLAFELARLRGKKLTSVDKANVLDVSQFWRDVVEEVAKDYPDVEYNHMLVDNAAMQLVRNPKQFDVIVTGNIFGDILSDEASMLTGSIGMLPSASIGGRVGMFEPIHGSAPDIAGLGIANPIAQIESAAMMLKYGLKLTKEAETIEKAVDLVLKMGYRTPDIYSEGKRKVNTQQMGDLIAKAIGDVA
ncbi:3-isopropylmalate dehydrogenase [Hippea jasoniae]|uniref:3-isopropylmalate dehydrogenase n=1 Tax=Hippea jasoniae TaxID=944479 RepID=UPI000551745C|nr:3-isopropylmalate dehydrogenase [Hippea jasoniae]